jgi:hypothetical protein
MGGWAVDGRCGGIEWGRDGRAFNGKARTAARLGGPGSTVPGRTGGLDNRADSRDHDGRWYHLGLPWDLGQLGGGEVGV